jgi:superfamily II DNA or RNA helicase
MPCRPVRRAFGLDRQGANVHNAFALGACPKQQAPSHSVMVKLRDYQSACHRAILDSYKDGIRRALVVLPTGTGKTVVFASLPQFFRMKHRMLVLAHREELLEQAREKFARVDPALLVGIEQASRRADPSAKVVVASVQTLGRRNSSRLRSFNPAEFKLIVVDEAHYAVAAGYRRVLDYFGVLQGPTDKLLLGFTATPVRGDKQGLDQVFEKIVFSRSMGEMIQAKWLCPIRGFRVLTDLDLSQIRTRMGDFALDELAHLVNEASRNRQIVRAYEKVVPGQKALVFCVNVAHSQEVAAEFCRVGIRAAPVWGEMPPEERAKMLAEFRSGALSVIVNCNVLSEGYDDPTIAAILMAMPT